MQKVLNYCGGELVGPYDFNGTNQST